MSSQLPDVTSMKTGNRPFNDVSWNDDTSRLDAVAKVTGRAKYSIDQVDGQPLAAGFLRCPWGKARLESVDTQAAKNVKGVVAVEVGENEVGQTYEYHGANAGHIVAENVSALKRGLRALNAKWKRLDAVNDLDAANPSQPDENMGDGPQDADFVLKAVYRTQVQTHSALETHGGRVDYKVSGAIVHGSTQSNFGFRDGLENALNLNSSAIEMHCEYVGGGFGAKFGPGKEGLLAARVSKQFNRPCIVFCDRAEEHLDTGNRPSSRQHYHIGVKKDGTIIGGSVVTFGGVGVAGGGGGMSGSPYNMGNVRKRHSDVQFNGGAPRAFRAPGHPQGAFGAEMAMEELAAGIGLDSLAFRKMNDPSSDRRPMYDVGAQLIGWSRRQPTGAQTGVIRRGFGMGVTEWGSRGQRAECLVIIHPDGSVEAQSGTQDMGQGQRTVMGVVAARHLGVPLAVVEAKVGSTDYPSGPASGGSVTATSTAPVMISAALDAKEQFLKQIADKTGVKAGDLDIHDGSVVQGNKTLLSWADGCRMLGTPVTGRGSSSDQRTREHRGTGHSNGMQFVELLVDTETGVVKIERIVAIQSCGQVVCRKTAESQIIGGVIQGISYALHEHRLLDRQTAAMVNPNLEMYKIAGARDIPVIEPVLWNDGATGVRSLGEPPTVPTSGAIAAAVFNAIGVPVRSLPVTPDRVIWAMANGKGAVTNRSTDRNGGGA